MIESKLSLKYIAINLIMSTIFILLVPFFETMVILTNYHANRPWSDYYWAKPSLFILPILYLFISLISLLRKNIYKSIFLFLMFLYVSLGFFMWNHDKETFDDFKKVFHLKDHKN